MKRKAAQRLAAFALLVMLVPPALATPPRGWRLGRFSHGAEAGTDRTTARTGKASGFLKATDPEGRVFGLLTQWVRADRYRGKRLRVSAYLKTQNVGPSRRSGARFDILVFGKTHRYVGAGMRGRLIQGTTDWRRYQHVIDVPGEAAALSLGIALVGPGQVWVDDVRLEVVGSEVSPTATLDRKAPLSADMQQRVEERLRSAPPRPLNLDFEGRRGPRPRSRPQT